VALLKSADPARLTVKKKVQCFLWNGEYYELQSFIQPEIGLSILRCEPDTGSEQDERHLPWFLSVQGEITGVKEFSSYFLAEHYSSPTTAAGPSVGQAPLRWQDSSVLMAAYERARTKRDE